MAMMVTIKGFSNVLDGVRRIQHGLLQKLGDEVVQITEYVALPRLKELTPKDTGETAARWFVVHIPRTGEWTSTIRHQWNEPGVIHPRHDRTVNDGKFNLLEALEYGTKPHKIQASRAPLLHFWWKRMGRWVRTFSVYHPGNRAYNFFRPTEAQAFAHIRFRTELIVKDECERV